MNNPYATTDKSPRHVMAKCKVAVTIDFFLEQAFITFHSDRYQRYHYYVDTEYEKNFGKMITSYGDREYTADIFITVYWLLDKNHIEKRFLSIEIDGQDHDSTWESSKDKGRDQYLETVLDVKTKRIDLYDILGLTRPRHKHKKYTQKPPKLSSEQIIQEINPLRMLGL